MIESLGVCPSCGALRRLDWRPDRPGTLDALITHAPGCERLPIARGGCEHAWRALDDPDGSIPWGWAVLRCDHCQALHVERDRDALRALIGATP